MSAQFGDDHEGTSLEVAMKRIRNAVRFGAAVLFVSFASEASGQWFIMTWMNFRDDAQTTDTTTVYFGEAVGATYCIDSISPWIREYEAPPLPPGFDVRFLGIPGRINSCYGQGLQRWNFYGAPGRPHIDTFQIALSNGDMTSATWVIRWQDSTSLSQTWDDAILLDPSGHMKPPKIDMMRQDSIVIPAAIDSGVTRLLVFLYYLITEVDQNPAAEPARYVLDQNFPNPFNPATTIRFEIPVRSQVTLTVSDILGREIARLVDRVMPPGQYSIPWDAADKPSGVYWYCLRTRSFTETKMMVLMK